MRPKRIDQGSYNESATNELRVEHKPEKIALRDVEVPALCSSDEHLSLNIPFVEPKPARRVAERRWVVALHLVEKVPTTWGQTVFHDPCTRASGKVTALAGTRTMEKMVLPPSTEGRFALLSKGFEMNYQEALACFTSRAPFRRKLAHKTYLWRHKEPLNSTLYLQLFDTDIIRYHPDGSFSLNHGGHPTMTTKDRIRLYSPGKCSMWRADEWIYLHTPKGLRPWKNNARFDKNFNRLDLQGLNRVDAGSMRVKARQYAIAYVRKLVYHGLPDPGGPRDCALCFMGAFRDDADEIEPDDTHHLEHIRKGTMPSSLMVRALFCAQASGGRAREAAMVMNCWSSKRALWRTPPTYEQALEATEEKLMGTFRPRLTPINYRVEMRELLEKYLLLQLGFEVTEERSRAPAGGWKRQ